MPKPKPQARYDLASLLANDPLHAKDLRLLKALRHLAKAAGKTVAVADAAYHEVQFDIDSLNHRTLREGRIRRQAERAADEEGEEGRRLRHRPWHIIARLVRAKRYQLGIAGRRRSSEPKAIERSLNELRLDPKKPNVKLGPDDLTPVETRAVELVRGEKANARKNRVEEQAIEIATAVNADLFREPRAGRPPNRRRNIDFDNTTDQYDLHLTATDVVETVLPSIERLAGSANSSAPGSAMIAAVVAAVKVACVDPKQMPQKKIGAVRKKFDAESAGIVTWRLQRERAKVKPLK
jgi:hypothetical protein